MERDTAANTRRDIDSKAAQVNTRFTSPLVINSASRRRGLFARPPREKDEDAAARPTSLGSVSDAKVASPTGTRIPRPTQHRPFTLSDAYRMAEEEEAAQGSPSPAPRSWRSRRASGEGSVARNQSAVGNHLQRYRGANEGPPRGATPRSGADDRGLPLQQSDLSNSSFDDKLRQYARDQPGPTDLMLTRSNSGTELLQADKSSARKPSPGRVDGGYSPGLAQPASHDLPPANSPSRSFAWQADADFTASDLQVSNSPPVVIRRSNTKIDEIRALEAKVKDQIFRSPQPRRRDLLTDHPRTQYDQSLSVPSNARPASEEAAVGAQMAITADEDGSPAATTASRAKTSIEGLRLRVNEMQSAAALAAAGEDGLRARKSKAPGSQSLATAHALSKEARPRLPPLGDRLRRQVSEGNATAVQTREPPTREDVLAQPLQVRDHASGDTAKTSSHREAGGFHSFQLSDPQSNDTPYNVPRQRTVPSNGSPAAEQQAIADGEASTTARVRELGQGGQQRRLIGGAKSEARPIVGFAGLQRSSSVESRLAKRTSFVHSDSDPTERIEGEMKLFAAAENQSEKGSLRVPSPGLEEEEEKAPDETPRPTKIDPLMLPTPRVTGAYVETPTTVKVEKPQDCIPGGLAEGQGLEQQTGQSRPLTTSQGVQSTSSLPRGGKLSLAAHEHKRAQSSGSDRAPGRASSLTSRRRARSLSRGRRPLTNSVRPPTVRDDILEIQRANQIDDSTLEDVADLLHQHGGSGAARASRRVKLDGASNDDLDREGELATYERISQSLKTGLLGIRTAKQGIENLEGKITHADFGEHAAHAVHKKKSVRAASSCPACHGSGAGGGGPVTYIHLPLPRLWSRHPKFRLTFLGFATFLLTFWYIAESWMCFRYCKPEYCYPGAPCDWSLDDPVWGYAIPVKLDQWVTSGQGRDLSRRLGLSVADWWADMWDAATGSDITTVDTSRYTWEQKRQRRRRLAKKGFSKPFRERPEDIATFSERKSVREAQEKAQSAHDMGYEVDEDESIASDETL